MIRINLLPVKAAQRRLEAKNELLILGGILLGILLGLYVWNAILEARARRIETRIQEVRAQIADLKRDVVRIDQFKKETKLYEKKLKVIEKLERQRTGPAKMLDDLATILTDQPKVWLTSLHEKNGQLTLEGGAMEHENISDFQLALKRRSSIFTDIRLLGVTTTKVKGGGTPFLTWKMRCKVNYQRR